MSVDLDEARLRAALSAAVGGVTADPDLVSRARRRGVRRRTLRAATAATAVAAAAACAVAVMGPSGLLGRSAVDPATAPGGDGPSASAPTVLGDVPVPDELRGDWVTEVPVGWARDVTQTLHLVIDSDSYRLGTPGDSWLHGDVSLRDGALHFSGEDQCGALDTGADYSWEVAGARLSFTPLGEDVCYRASELRRWTWTRSGS